MSNKEERKAPVLRFKGFTDDWEIGRASCRERV